LSHGSVSAEAGVTRAATRRPATGGHHTPRRLPHAVVCTAEPKAQRERERRRSIWAPAEAEDDALRSLACILLGSRTGDGVWRPKLHERGRRWIRTREDRSGMLEKRRQRVHSRYKAHGSTLSNRSLCAPGPAFTDPSGQRALYGPRPYRSVRGRRSQMRASYTALRVVHRRST
jgi:hypothetical protein